VLAKSGFEAVHDSGKLIIIDRAAQAVLFREVICANTISVSHSHGHTQQPGFYNHHLPFFFFLAAATLP
jgi:hypothetical protein